MWESLSIAQKIWLSLSILIMGYLISTGFGFLLGHQTESRLHAVSEYLFTASKQSQLALSAFEEQIRFYNDLIMIGNIGKALEFSKEKGEEVQNVLQAIIALKGINSKRLHEVSEILRQLKGFSDSAQITYMKISPDSEYIFESEDEKNKSLENEIFRLGQQTNELRDKLTALSQQFSDDFRAELAAISHASRRYRYLDIAFFLGNILILAAIVSFILSRHVLTPIRMLTNGTQALTSLKFETSIDVTSKDELGQLASNFNLMAQTLKRYEHMRKQWISDISHELRTPLSVLRAEIEAVQDGIREMTRGTLDSLHTEVLFLSKIVEDIHQLSLADTGTLYLRHEQVKPLHVLKETINHFRNRFLLHNITIQENLETDHSITIMGDADRLKQVFSNLFENSLRYTQPPGTLKIWQDCKRNRLSLHFEDSGPGVPEESLEHLFDRLYRVDKSRSRAKGGSGLGLAICKNIVESHGGQIMAANGLSGGLLIEITLPVFEAQHT